jgi:hypothetical protein
MGKQVIIMTALVLGLVTSITAAGPDPNLMGYWKFEGDTLDSSGHDRTGTLVGNATFAAGLDGQALTLDGSGDYMRVDSYLGILGGNPFSITAWVSTTNTGDRTMVCWGSSTNGQRVDFRLYQGRLRIEHGNGNLQGNTNLANGEWHHVALVVGPNASIQQPDTVLYLDGKNDSQTTADADKFNLTASVPVTIGQRRTNNDRAFLGLLDEVRIYDRMLTAEEIKAQAAHPKAYQPSPANGAQDVGTPLFTWAPRETALWHDVYLGTDPNLTSAHLVAPRAMAALYWHLAGLTPGTTYYWRVDEIDPDETVHTGDVWSFFFMPKEAWTPVPTDGEPYTDPNVTLSWKTGLGAISHDVYFGADQAQVAQGAAGVFKGNQITTTFPVGVLPVSSLYYWRVDEVAPDGTKVKGSVWTFQTLPEIAVAADPNLAAWWTLDEGAGTRIVDWSGHGHHGQFNGTGAPTWVQGYDGSALSFGGPGARDYVVTSYPGVTGIHSRTTTAWIKTATIGEIISWGQNVAGQKWIFRVQESNGTVGAIRVEVNGGYQVGWTDVRDNEWHHVAAVLDSDGTPDALEISLYVDGWPEASSASLDEPINTIDTGIVRIGEAPWHNRPFTGIIDDVRVYDKALKQEEIELILRVDPLRAWMPQPANGAIADIRTVTPLTWTKGDNASKHDVYFGTDPAAVADANAADTTGIYRGRISAASFTPAEDLAWGRKYFWRVDEVNTDGSLTTGKVWTFTVADYLIVDDFESYTNVEAEAVFSTWIDGFTNGLSGSTVGNLTAPFAERTIVYSGAQAMPMDYNNTNSPWYSEAERTFSPVEDWTFGDANTLVVHFRGQPADFLEAAGTFTLGAAGVDIWNTADEFRYVFKRLTGDGSIIARVDSITNTNVWAKGGVMIRESLDPGSRHAMMVATPGSGVAFQRRLTTNDVSVGTTQAGVVTPCWVKLTRTGDLLTAQHSADGVTWTDVVGAAGTTTSDTVVMGGTIYIGLALTSHAANVACTAVFSEVSTTGTVTGAWTQTEIGVDHPGNSPQGLYVALEDSTGKVAVVTHPDPAATALTAWTEWSIPLSDFTGVNPARIKKMYVGVGDRKNPVPDGAGRIYIDDIRITKGAPGQPSTTP